MEIIVAVHARSGQVGQRDQVAEHRIVLQVEFGGAPVVVLVSNLPSRGMAALMGFPMCRHQT